MQSNPPAPDRSTMSGFDLLKAGIAEQDNRRTANLIDAGQITLPNQPGATPPEELAKLNGHQLLGLSIRTARPLAPDGSIVPTL
jgi:hypothetical protein